MNITRAERDGVEFFTLDATLPRTHKSLRTALE
jgi:hypothetical protein